MLTLKSVDNTRIPLKKTVFGYRAVKYKRKGRNTKRYLRGVWNDATESGINIILQASFWYW